jgi:hypothetical protein
VRISVGVRHGLVSALRVSRPLTEYYSDTMTNRFGLHLPPDRLRWAVAEGVSEDVICAVLLLHEHSVNEIAPKLSPAELEKVLVLVGRNSRLYPPGTVQALESKRAVLPPQPAKAVPRKAVAIDEAEPSTRAFRTGPEGAQARRSARNAPNHLTCLRAARLRWRLACRTADRARSVESPRRCAMPEYRLPAFSQSPRGGSAKQL